jgi:hypothetical protein
MKTKIWFGEIPEIFGYGISCLGNSRKEVMEAMKKKYKRLKEQAPDEETNFKTSYEYYDGRIWKVELGKGYHGGLGE